MPTRYSLIALAVAAVFICYIDRVIIAIAIIPMAADFGWSAEEQGRILASFFAGYLLTQLVGGWLAQRFGGKVVLGAGVVFWSIFTMLTPIAATGGLAALIITRVLMGVGEGVTFPAIYTLYGRWLPENERSRAVGMLFSAIPLGSVVALVATPMLVTNYGWQTAFYLFGAFGIVWWFAWQKFTAATPDEHPRVSAEELQEIRGSAEKPDDSVPPTMKQLVSKPAVWAIIVSHFCANWGTYVLLAWLPTYFNKGLGVDFSQVGVYTMIPYIFAFLSLNMGGWIADKLLQRGFDRTWVRKVMQAIGFSGLAIVLAVVGYVDSLPLAIVLMSVGNIFGGTMAGGYGVNHLDIAPKGAGTIMGLSNTAGTVPGILGVYVSGMILEATDSWVLVFQTAAGVLTFGMLFYLFFASSKRLFD